MSNLRQIVTAISNLTVTFTNELNNSVTVTNYDVNALPRIVPAADLPIRMLGVARGSSSSDWSRVSAGLTDGQINHSIAEIALIEMVGLSRMQDEWCDVMRYCDRLVVVLQANQNIYAKSEIISATCNRGVYEYPEGSGDVFYGAQTDVLISEYI